MAASLSGALAVVLLALPHPALAQQIPERLEPIPNYQVVRPGLATAGQPPVEILRQLKELGFRTVVNLRTEAEGTASEKEIVTSEGLRYVSVPISPFTFSLDDVHAVAKVLDDPEAGPVLLHCASANRVGAVWAVMEVEKGKSLAEAEAEGRKVGLHGETMIEAMERVAREASGQK